MRGKDPVHAAAMVRLAGACRRRGTTAPPRDPACSAIAPQRKAAPGRSRTGQPLVAATNIARWPRWSGLSSRRRRRRSQKASATGRAAPTLPCPGQKIVGNGVVPVARGTPGQASVAGAVRRAARAPRIPRQPGSVTPVENDLRPEQGYSVVLVDPPVRRAGRACQVRVQRCRFSGVSRLRPCSV